jgi:hypothetical protein
MTSNCGIPSLFLSVPDRGRKSGCGIIKSEGSSDYSDGQKNIVHEE